MAGGFGVGQLTVRLGADTKGLTALVSAMLQVERQILQSVSQMNASLTSFGAKGAAVSDGLANNFVKNEQKKQKELAKTNQLQDATSGGGRLAITKTDVSNVLAENQAVAVLAARYKVTEGVIREAIRQRIAVEKEAKKETEALIREAQRQHKELEKKNALRIASANKEADAITKSLKQTAAKNNAINAQAQKEHTQIWQKRTNELNAYNNKLVALAKKAAQEEINARLKVVQAEGKIQQQRIAQAIATSEAVNKANNVSLKSFTSGLATMAQRVRTFGYLASAVITLPLVQAGKAAFNMAKEFEFSIQKIVGLTGVAQGTVNKWKEEVLKMAPALGKSPKELADALYFISSSGIKGAEALDVLQTSAKASAAGLGETQVVANLLTSSLNAYAGTGLTAAKAADILVAAIREGKAEATDFANSMGQIIPIASNLGVSFDQVAGGMAAITLTGSSASNAAVYLKGVFNSLLTASAQGETALNAMGTSYAELRKILASGGVIPLMQKLRDLQMKWGEEAISDVLPNIRALTGYMSIAGKNFAYNAELIKRVTNSTGSLNVAFQAIAGTIQQRYNKAMASLQVGMVTFGKSVASAMLPVLEKLVDKLNRLIVWFDSLSETQKRSRIQFLAFVAAAGPLSLVLSALMYSVTGLIGLLKGLWTALKYTVAFMKSLTFAIAEMPWLWLAYALAIVTVAVVKLIREKNALSIAMGKVQEETHKELTSLTLVNNRILEAAQGTKKRTDAIEAFNSNYGKYLSNLISEKSSVDDIKKAYEQAAEGVKVYTKAKVLQEELDKRSDKTSKVFRNQLSAFRKAILDYNPSMLGDFYDRVYAAADKAIEKGGGKVDEETKNQEITKLYNEFISDIQKNAQKGSLTISAFGASVSRVMEMRSREFPLNEELRKTNRELDKVIDNAEKAQIAVNNFALPDYAKRDQSKVQSIQEVWNKLMKSMESYNTLQKSYANAGDKSMTFQQEKFNAIKEAFEGLSLIITDKADPALVQVTKLMKDAQAQMGKTEQVQKLSIALTELWKNMLKEIDTEEKLVEFHKKQSRSYDLVKEKAKIYLKYLEQALTTPGGEIMSNKIFDFLKKLGYDFSETAMKAREFWDDLKASTAAVDMKKIMMPSFDANTAKMEIFKKSYEDFIGLLMENKGVSQISGPFAGIDLMAQIALADKLYKEYEKYLNLSQQDKDTQLLNLLQAEANAYGTLATKIEVVSFMLQAQEKASKNALMKGLSPFSEEAKKMAANIIITQEELAKLQGAQNIKWAVDLFNATKNGSDGIAVLGARIDWLNEKMKLMSANGDQATESFKQLAIQVEQLKRAQEFAEALQDSFSNLFVDLMSGAESAGKAFENFAKSVGDSIKRMVADMIAQKIVGLLISLFTGGMSKSTGGMSKSLFTGITKAIGGFAGFAQGGMVPPGYPNDSYPAMLSSGETVLPKGIASSINNASYQFEDVKFVIEDNQLVGILRKSDNKKSAY